VLTIRTGPGDGLVVVSLRSAVWMAVGSIKLILPENDREHCPHDRYRNHYSPHREPDSR
jgi:hypothetical protein